MRFNKWRRLLMLSLVIGVFEPLSIETVRAQSMQSSGSISFTGELESENDPEPVPPSGPYEEVPPSEDSEALETEDLPQANQLSYKGWSCLGFIIMITTIIIERKKGRNENEKIINFN